MEDNLKNSLLSVCKVLENYGLDYMLVGGTAVALNGYYRRSINIAGELTDKPDIDVWYNPTYENYFKVLRVMEELGYDVAIFKDEQAPNPKRSFFKLEFDDFTIDFLPEIKATIKFSKADQNKEIVEIDGTRVVFMNYFDLIKDKEATGRKQDFEDIQQLKKNRGKV